jgi:adenylyl-sulfate kinase
MTSISGGFTAWFTGLPSAGKTTVSKLVGAELERRGALVEHLDGDVVRSMLSKGLGFSKEDRDTNVERIGWVASRLTRAGAVVLVSAISPYEAVRARVRSMVEEHGVFLEIFVDAPLQTCIQRDPKGLYARALAGELSHFTGVSDPYEPPRTPEVALRTDREPAEESARRVLLEIERRGLVAGRPPAALRAVSD